MMIYMFIPNIVVGYYYKALQHHDLLLRKIEELATQVLHAYIRTVVFKHEYQRSASKSTDSHTFPMVDMGDLAFLVVSALLFYVLLKLTVAYWRQFYHDVLENMTWRDVEAFVASPAATLIILACILQPFIWSYQLCMWTLKTTVAALESFGFEMGVGI
ncbi:hypothetical protein DL95DRAFT_464184 [Leptodontidium sp. 2 PMI_412]|nr:hypothetical protein DL95DRAFT_464184 [Leptodontidium sp. 2 PMI_412]